LGKTQRLLLASGKTIDLAIPKGAEEGHKMRLAGQGEPGPAGAGDAIVMLLVAPDQRFVRDGADIRHDLAVPLETAVLGGKLRVPTLEGEVMLSVAPGTSSGKVMRLKGKGWPARDGSRGDLLAKVMVQVPNDPALADFLRARVPAG
jgi:DnaJ-class molecular chaperone